MGKELMVNVSVNVPYDNAGFKIGSNAAIKAALTAYYGASVGRLAALVSRSHFSMDFGTKGCSRQNT